MHDIYKCSKEYALIAFFVVLLWTVQCDQLKYIQLSSSRVDYLYNNNTSSTYVDSCSPAEKNPVWWFPVLISLCSVTAHRLIFIYDDLHHNYFPTILCLAKQCSTTPTKGNQASRGGVFYERRIGPNKKIFFIL